MNALGSRTATDDDDKLVTVRTLQALGLDVHRDTIARWVKEGSFPAPLRLSGRKHVWRLAEVRAWLAARENA
jgi:predicted DNA-binding transcriptional regulator AlpA